MHNAHTRANTSFSLYGNEQRCCWLLQSMFVYKCNTVSNIHAKLSFKHMLHIHLRKFFHFFFLLFASSIFLISTLARTHKKKQYPNQNSQNFAILLFHAKLCFVRPFKRNEWCPLFSKANQIKWSERYLELSLENTRALIAWILLFCVFLCTLYDLGSCSIQLETREQL